MSSSRVMILVKYSELYRSECQNRDTIRLQTLLSYLRRSTCSDFDLDQSGYRDMPYTIKMEHTLTQLRFLLAAIVLIAGSLMVSSSPGLSGEASGIAVNFGVAGDSTAHRASGSHQVTNRVAATNQDSQQNGCRQECSMNCVPSAGSSCCATAVSSARGCKTLDREAIAAYGIVDAELLAAGVDPEALLRPPQIPSTNFA